MSSPHGASADTVSRAAPAQPGASRAAALRSRSASSYWRRWSAGAGRISSRTVAAAATVAAARRCRAAARFVRAFGPATASTPLSEARPPLCRGGKLPDCRPYPSLGRSSGKHDGDAPGLSQMAVNSHLPRLSCHDPQLPGHWVRGAQPIASGGGISAAPRRFPGVPRTGAADPAGPVGAPCAAAGTATPAPPAPDRPHRGGRGVGVALRGRRGDRLRAVRASRHPRPERPGRRGGQLPSRVPGQRERHPRGTPRVRRSRSRGGRSPPRRVASSESRTTTSWSRVGWGSVDAGSRRPRASP